MAIGSKSVLTGECEHSRREGGVCALCGHCEHDVILNGSCFYCGSSELDGVAFSPKPTSEFIPASRLTRGSGGEPVRSEEQPAEEPTE